VQNLNTVPVHEVIRRVGEAEGAFAAWIGAGLSLEAGIKAGADICSDIKTRLAEAAKASDPDSWAREHLDWDDPGRRYGRCLSALGNPAARIKYFRRIIRDVQPSFSHHAITLLMRRGRIRKSCLTTNFDKLLEMAFAQQSVSEYQAIRSEDEQQYWGYEDKYYVIKLHGDYDTANILNTDDEAIRIPKALQEISTRLLWRSGLLVLGSSGYEQSVIAYFDDLWFNGDRSILEFGVYWGVYMGEHRPPGMTADQEDAELRRRLAQGGVSRNIVENAKRAVSARRDFNFFPVWGGAEFLFQLIEGLGDASLTTEARRYLDHKMRVRDVLARGGLNRDAIDARLRRLEERARQQREQGASPVPQPIHAWHARRATGGHQVNVLYGDLASFSLLAFPLGEGRRAVVSPDDTFLSAGGGAALSLLERAGKAPLLSEVSKFSSVTQRDVVVTSAFNLPVNYIFHAATVALNPDGSSNTTTEDVRTTMTSALRAAEALSVRIVLTPLIGAGTEAVPTEQSLKAMLSAFGDFIEQAVSFPLVLAVAIRHEAELSRIDVGRVLESVLPGFELTRIPVAAA
jgi:O-acetyl-ADP-ribose deacetylase (regulator of RNase III)